VGEKILKHLCGGLFVLGKLPNVFGATNLGKGRDCLDANERFFVTYTLQECGPQGVVYVLADESVMKTRRKGENTYSSSPRCEITSATKHTTR